jgi:hypothetical protein
LSHDVHPSVKLVCAAAGLERRSWSEGHARGQRVKARRVRRRAIEGVPEEMPLPGNWHKEDV